MIVSFTGAQSTGKSTLLDALQRANEFNNRIVFVPEVTRILQREYNIPINEGASAMTQYQITCDHYRNAFKKEPTITQLKVLDRCALDGTVYCNYFNEQRKFNNHYSAIDANGDYNADWEKATRMSERYLPDMMEKYDILFYTDPKDVPLVDDGERSASAKFRDGIIELFERYIAHPKYADKVITLSGTVEERLSIIQEAIKVRDSSINLKIRN
jgi:nicotinamide riboside kinase